ncbi:MAG TPA: tRNA lysidine(34) synthetase TilS [Candidatus Cryosericum sp.]|nr:tRNA lysidine(34) synthetase TilS [Candidatus Cryosericum sp.]
MLPGDVWSSCVARGLLAPGMRVVVAVSGGSDSVALVHLLCALREQYGLQVSVAHFNHRLRGADSDADQAFVENLAASLGVPCDTGTDDVHAYAAEHRLSQEEAARELRLRFLRMTAITQAADRIATGHTQDDQAETVLFRLLKGTGVRGLAGMAPRSGMMIRPLLPFSKQELQEWLVSQNLAWREDASNSDGRFERNFVRSQLIPLAESRFPAARQAVARTADMAREIVELLDRQTEQVTDNIQILEAGDGRHPGALRLSREALASLPDALLEFALGDVFQTAGVGPSYERLRRSVAAIRRGQAGRRVTLDDRLSLEVGYQHVYVYGAAYTDRVEQPREVSQFPATVDWFRRRISFEERGPADVPADLRQLDSKEAWFDRDAVRLPLVVRQPEPGDRMATFGGHVRKLQDLFVDAKVDRLMRPRRPVICDTEGILWVPALARSARAPVLPESHRLLRIVYYSSQC